MGCPLLTSLFSLLLSSLSYRPEILYATIIHKKIKIPTENGRRPHPKWKTTSPKMEDDQNGRRPTWKMTKLEDDQNGRRPKCKTTKTEDDQNGRRPKWKKTKMEDGQKLRRPKTKTTKN